MASWAPDDSWDWFELESQQAQRDRRDQVLGEPIAGQPTVSEETLLEIMRTRMRAQGNIRVCRRCSHEVYVTYGDDGTSCPECGEVTEAVA